MANLKAHHIQVIYQNLWHANSLPGGRYWQCPEELTKTLVWKVASNLSSALEQGKNKIGYLLFDWLKNVWDKSVLVKGLCHLKNLTAFFLPSAFCGLTVTGLLLLGLLLIKNHKWRSATSFLLLTCPLDSL